MQFFVFFVPIKALDPAKPMFVFADAEHRIGNIHFRFGIDWYQQCLKSFVFTVSTGPDDADFVQVVHTDSLERGILAASGHVDFYSKRNWNTRIVNKMFNNHVHW